MFLVGLTGGIACGKSTVSKIFRDNGVFVVDADQIARQVVEPGKPAYNQLRTEFGAEYFNDEIDGSLNREKMGNLVFHNVEARKKLNKITHTAIRKEMLWLIIQQFFHGKRFIVLDIPLLFEGGLNRFVQKIVVVSCDSDTQLERLCQRDGLSKEQAEARISSQLPNEYKVKRATYIIDNQGSVEETREQVHQIVSMLNSSWIPYVLRTGLLMCLVVAGYCLWGFFR
ncbi:unnamed protein product [Bursaphelenchus xylophilus]|uniref:Dephospho-CoA kinase domain-containing protein n=1 Tax=Bursaphelenchus xylophilus TaxID=6326 RepID=A0A1I7RNB5_BURXY|nr:unnamed protein product [Bursaphelenchus xylophilus]CAG9123842.1 unnamed protein product [Bursaphelenchus xylophilus]